MKPIGDANGLLYVRDVTHPDGECPLHGTEGDCPCTDTGLLTEADLRRMSVHPEPEGEPS